MSVESSSIQPGFSKTRLRVLNSTEATVVTPDVIEIDTARETFTAVAQRLKGIASGGIWLNPLRGVPRVSFMPELDIVYLDEQCEVLRCVESYRQSSMELPQVSAVSAVVLPAGCLRAAGIRAGNQLEIHEIVSGVRRAGKLAAARNDEVRADAGESQEESVSGRRSLFAGLFGGGSLADRRIEKRHEIPGSVAYFSIGSPQAQAVKDISTDGFYVRTEDRWQEGTSLLVGLEITNPATREVEAMISVRSKVVRTGPDGVGFVYDDDAAHRDPMYGATNPEQLVQLQRFMQRIQRG